MITRRQFLRRGALWVPSLAIARATLAQEQYLQNRRKAFRTSPAADVPPVAGYILWLKTPIVGLSDTNAVANWPDSSGYGNDAAQSSGTKQPIYKTAIQNGRDVVRFDTTNDCLVTPSVDLTGTSGVTLFVAFNPAGSTASYRMLVEMSSDYTLVADSFVIYKDVTSSGRITAGLNGDVGLSRELTAGNDTGVWTYTASTYDKSLASAECKLYLKGVRQTSLSNSNNSGTFGNRSINIGSRNNGATMASGADIGMILLYATALSDPNRQSVEAWIASDWAL